MTTQARDAAPQTVVTCAAPYARGGLGRHLEMVVEASRPCRAWCLEGGSPADDVEVIAGSSLTGLTPWRWLPSARVHATVAGFDSAAARRLRPSRRLIAFSTAALRTMQTARRLDYEWITLQSPTAHLAHVLRRNAVARQIAPIEQGWLGSALLRRGLNEYPLADRIEVTSTYSWQTFVEAGVPEDRLALRVITPHPRFRPRGPRRSPSRFRVVFVGALTVTKGVTVLVEAFRQFQVRDAELILIGGWASRGMRRYIEAAIADDRRIKVAPGDPLPLLSGAGVLVHPSFQDGLGLAPLEALACGVPVIVSEDTGMKEQVIEGVNGYVVRTGDKGAIVDRLEHLAQHSLTPIAAGSA